MCPDEHDNAEWYSASGGVAPDQPMPGCGIGGVQKDWTGVRQSAFGPPIKDPNSGDGHSYSYGYDYGFGYGYEGVFKVGEFDWDYLRQRHG